MEESVPSVVENHANGTKPRGRLKNLDYRPREYLTQAEVERLVKAAGRTGPGRARWQTVRDRALIQVMFRHALCSVELRALRWDQCDMPNAEITVSRVKNGRNSHQPLEMDTMRALKAWQKLQAKLMPSCFIFTSQRETPFSKSGLRDLVHTLGKHAGMPFSVHPHMLRHARGYEMEENGTDALVMQKVLGHRNLSSTTIYAEVSTRRLRSAFRV